MSKLSELVEQRLRAAQELMLKDKAKGLQSPNYTHLRLTFRTETLIPSLLHTATHTHSQLLTEIVANNNVMMIDICERARKHLHIQNNDSIQLFCRKKLITNLYSTAVRDLRADNEQGPLEIQVTKMQVF